MSEMLFAQIDLSMYVEQRLMGARPHIRGRRLPIAFIASAARHADVTVSDLAREFSVSEEQILAALLYYYEHRARIDAQEAVDHVAWEANAQIATNPLSSS